LHQFADTIFKDGEQLKKWTDDQKQLLLQSKVNEVIGNIKATGGSKARCIINQLL
jgi:hypothetical protein